MMFTGMAGCLIVYELWHLISIYLEKRKAKNDSSYVAIDKSVKADGTKRQDHFITYLVVSLPALCDLAATASMNIGLLWIDASIWQMLRGSMTIFSAIFTKFCLRRQVRWYQWIGVCFVCFALCVVALCALLVDKAAVVQVEDEDGNLVDSATSAATWQVILGMTLTVLAQIIQASQIVIEEYLLKDAEVNPVLIVGLEGIWGFLVCSGVCMSIITWAVPAGIDGLSEDSVDTFVMLINTPTIIGLCTVYATVILLYNLFGMLVTQVSSAVIRTILEGLRTACIWVVQLIIGLFVSDDSVLGETWNDFSYLQVCGFLFLIEGLFIYNGHFRFSCFDYSHLDKKAETPEGVEDEEEKNDEEDEMFLTGENNEENGVGAYQRDEDYPENVEEEEADQGDDKEVSDEGEE